jgi:hypothetical protein
MGTNRVKNYLIAGLACLVVALVVGFEPVQRVINEASNKGTLKGVESCMSYSDSELLSKEAIKATCVSAFQKRLYHDEYATGRAGPNTRKGVVGWGGVLENETSDHVTTWVRISVSIFDDKGVEKEYFAETSIWIDPLGESEFEIQLPDLEPEQFESIEFCERESSAPSACMAWGVTDVMGLSI